MGNSDHNMLLLLPKYVPVIKRCKPVKKSIQIWNERACEELRGCFACTEWSVFVDECSDVEELNDCVTEYIKFCEDIVCERKEITITQTTNHGSAKSLNFY